MARQKQLSKEKRVAIITLRNEGPSVRKIGKTLKVSLSAVAKTIKRYKKTGSHEDRPRKGRVSEPIIWFAAEDKFIRVTSLRNRRLSAAQIRDQVNATQQTHLSATTVKRRLCESGLHGRIAARKPLIRTGNKQKYLTKKESDGVLRQMSRMKAKGPTSAKHLWELLQDYWKTISGDYLLKLIKRMTRVCEAVIKAKGGYFEEPRI
uniref:Transposase Tc1-like domain-containing protein n=1 Tax=Poecilia formosa TaxID=48698 RepID=A0A096MAI3_POEFO